jgi:hypothetical protein
MVALLQNTTSLRQAVDVWKKFCSVLNSKKKTKPVEKAVRKMTTMMRNASLQTDDSDEDSIFTESKFIYANLNDNLLLISCTNK